MEGEGSHRQNVLGTPLGPSSGGRGLGQIEQQLTHPAPTCSQAHNGSERHR
jgi:hypothetical protein